MEHYEMLINGEWTQAISGSTYPVYNPATNEIIAELPKGGMEDANKAIEAARRAFPEWSGKTQNERSAIVNQIGTLIREDFQELAMIDCLDHGTPIAKARMMAIGAALSFEYAAQASRALMSDVMPINNDTLHYFRREPVGVCGLIIPWNVPLIMVASKLGAALSVGNTCVVKPPSIDSMAALRLGKIIEKLNLPPGVVNIITGPGEQAGQALTTHPDVNLISFTGSSETGKRIMGLSSQSVKRLILELGGKNPFIVLEDANLEATVNKAVISSYTNSGMVCASPGRYYIHARLHDEFVDRFVEGAKKFTVGDPLSEKTLMGPLVSAEHRNTVEGYIRSGVEEGAQLVLDGRGPHEAPMDRGYFIKPTVFTNVTQDMKIAREEIFGPVACIMKFESEEEVLASANDNVYGLSASVWSQNAFKAIKMANRIQAGTVWINDHLTISPEMPWGGFKDSGIGKENAMVGLEAYTQLKLIALNLV
jgi:betaine-aldehyde dehydrogenase